MGPEGTTLIPYPGVPQDTCWSLFPTKNSPQENQICEFEKCIPVGMSPSHARRGSNPPEHTLDPPLIEAIAEDSERDRVSAGEALEVGGEWGAKATPEMTVLCVAVMSSASIAGLVCANGTRCGTRSLSLTVMCPSLRREDKEPTKLGRDRSRAWTPPQPPLKIIYPVNFITHEPNFSLSMSKLRLVPLLWGRLIEKSWIRL